MGAPTPADRGRFLPPDPPQRPEAIPRRLAPLKGWKGGGSAARPIEMFRAVPKRFGRVVNDRLRKSSLGSEILLAIKLSFWELLGMDGHGRIAC